MWYTIRRKNKKEWWIGKKIEKKENVREEKKKRNKEWINETKGQKKRIRRNKFKNEIRMLKKEEANE